MGWIRDLFLGEQTPDVAMQQNESPLGEPPSALRFGVDVPAEMLQAMTGGGAIAPRISRNEALQVPAVLRARNLICIPATLPLRYIAPDRTAGQWSLFEQIDPDVPNSVVWAQTYEDLLFEGIAWWRVTEFGWHGYPKAATHVPVGSVHVAGVGGLTSQTQIGPDQPWPVDGRIYIDGIPITDDREVIRFDSPNPPLLTHAARAIRTCLKLDQAVQLYSEDPVPLGIFKPDPDAESLEKSEIEDILDEWDQSRRHRQWGYVQGMTPHELQWNPEQLQLADQRQHAVLEIARACGIDPEDLGVSTTSRTYQNAEQRRLDLIDFTLGSWVSAVQDRLSMGDVTPRGYKARIDFGGFLRGDTKTRMETYKIGLEVGAYTEDEVRELENRPPLSPAQRAAARDRTPSVGQPPTREPQMSNGHPTAVFADEATGLTVTFDDQEVYESFSVDAESRTISGLLVPWNKIARAMGRKWEFTEGSLYWSSPARVKLNRHHDHKRIIAFGTRLSLTSRGVEGVFKVGSDVESSESLLKAKEGLLDGFSVEVEPEEWGPHPSDNSVTLVERGRLFGVALTGTPSFDDARVTAVAASRDQEKVDASQGNDRPARRTVIGFRARQAQ